MWLNALENNCQFGNITSLKKKEKNIGLHAYPFFNFNLM